MTPRNNTQDSKARAGRQSVHLFSPTLSVAERRRAMRLANWNGAVWALGNGLASSLLVVYLAMELKVPRIGLGISLILAAPHLAGLLRLSAPPLIGRLVDRKHFCLTAYLASAVVLLALPWLAAPGLLPSAALSLAALVSLWCGYQVLEFLGSLALWSWLADVVPLEVRGRFLGRRERWMAAGQAIGMLSGAGLIWRWHGARPLDPLWLVYAVTACTGAAFMLAALMPLAGIPRAAFSRAARSGVGLRAMLAPLADHRFLRLLALGCWLACCAGAVDMPQNTFPNWVLGLSVSVMLWLKTGLRVGQLSVAPWLGRLVDRRGNRPVLIACLALIAPATLFYCAATRQHPWWIIGAWVAWIAWAGLNISLPNLMLRLSPAQSNTPYIALYFTATGLCLAASTVLGGACFDHYRNWTYIWPGHFTLDYYRAAFLVGWLGRSLGVLLALVLVEPKVNLRAREE